MHAREIKVVRAMISADNSEFFFSIMAMADVTTAVGNAEAKIMAVFTVFSTGSMSIMKKIITGTANIFTRESISRSLFLAMRLMLLSPSCIPTTIMESGTVISPISDTVSFIMFGSFRPSTSIATATSENIVDGLQNVLISFLKLNLLEPAFMLRIKGPAEYIYTVRQILCITIRYNMFPPNTALVMGKPMNPLFTVEKERM